MIRQRISKATILNRLKELEKAQNSKNFISVLFIGVENNGKICVDTDSRTRLFDTMFEAEDYISTLPGFTEQSKILLDDTICASNNLYLPSDPILYFLDSEERTQFISAMMDSKEWLTLYIDLVQRILAESNKGNNTPLPGFNAPALQDLLANYNSMSIEQLIERYENQKWFTGKALC